MSCLFDSNSCCVLHFYGEYARLCTFERGDRGILLVLCRKHGHLIVHPGFHCHNEQPSHGHDQTALVPALNIQADSRIEILKRSLRSTCPSIFFQFQSKFSSNTESASYPVSGCFVCFLLTFPTRYVGNMADAAYWPLLKKCLPQKIPSVFVGKWCPLFSQAWSHACHQLLAGGWSTASFRSCFFLKFTKFKKQAQKVPPAYESKGVEWAYAAYAYAKNWSGCKKKLFTTQCNLTRC